ncbi:mucin-2-like [Perca fluviatilis]|uniref:mucin-2-like n=1 Tax=Perca fluviatilis TaxID=8168 RepID=UPI0019660526|nr:mucin-2-like [Perca fluviatilis]XP_039678100.1 mucin-2-like [Perca fluviatilis]
MEYHSGGSLPLLGRPRYCPGANANGGYLCETGHCCGETGCCTYYYELWWFWLLWTVLILFSCCCAYRHRRAKQRVQQQQRQREISLLAYHGANSYPSSMLDLSFLASLKLPSYEEVAAQPSTPPPPYSSVFTSPRYPQPPRAADPHLLTQHDPLLHRPISTGPSSLSSDNSSSCSCDSCCPSSPCSSSLSAPVTYETDTSHATTPGEATPLTFDVTLETISAAATCLEVNETRFVSERMVGAVAVDIVDEDANGAQEPDSTDSSVPNQAVTVAVVTRAASPQPLPSPGTEVALSVLTTSPMKQQLDLAPCTPLVSPITLPSPSVVDTTLPSIQITSIEGPAEGPETTPAPKITSMSGPPTPTACTSDSPTETQTLDLTRTFDTTTLSSSPTSILSPDDRRTLTLITSSAGLPTSDPNPSLVPIPGPSNITQVPSPVPSNFTQVPSQVPSNFTQVPSPVSSNFTQVPSPVPSNITQVPSPVPSNITQVPSPVPSNFTQVPSPVPSNFTQVPSPVPSNFTQGPDPILTNLTQAPAPVPSSLIQVPKQLPSNITQVPDPVLSNIYQVTDPILTPFTQTLDLVPTNLTLVPNLRPKIVLDCETNTIVTPAHSNLILATDAPTLAHCLVPPSPTSSLPQHPGSVAVLVSCLDPAAVPADSGPSLVLSQSSESVGSRSGPLSTPAPVLTFPTQASSSSPSSCPAITIDSESSYTSPVALTPSLPSPSSLPTFPALSSATSLPAPALLLDPLSALHQSNKGGSSSGHASSLSPSPRATQSPPKQTLFSPCVDIFEPGPPCWEEGEEDQEKEEDNDDDEDEDMGADESQYRHRRLTGDSGIEVCRCRVEEEEDEEEEEEEEERERKEDGRRGGGGGGGGGGERDTKGGGNTDLHDSVDCPARGQVTTGEGLILCNSTPTPTPTSTSEDSCKIVIVMETV